MEEFLEVGKSCFCLGDDHHAISFFVETMEESCTDKISHRRDLLITMVKGSYDRGMFDSSDGIGMCEDAWSLVDDDIVRSLMHDREIDLW